MNKHQSARSHRRQAYIYLIINTICWGAALVIVKPAFQITTPFRFLLYRYLIAGLFFSIPYLLKKRHQLKNLPIMTIAAIELFGTVFSLSILFYGLALTSAIEASLIGTTGPIFITLAGIILLHERQEKCEWWGLLLSLAGSVLIVITHNELNQQLSLAGNLLVMAFNLTNALYFIAVKKYYRHLDKTLVGAVSFIVGLIGFSIINLVIADGNLHGLITNIILDWQYNSVQVAAIYMAIFGSVIGLITYIKGQDKIEASEASLFTYLQPLIFLPLGVWLLQESIYPQQIVGFGIVLLGVLIAEKRSHV